MDAIAAKWATWPDSTKQRIATMCGLTVDASFDEVLTTAHEHPDGILDLPSVERLELQSSFEDLDQSTVDLWASRLRNKGFHEDFPKWKSNDERSWILIALQLLYVCDPARALHFAASKDSAQDEATFDETSRVYEIFRSVEPHRGPAGILDLAWSVLTADVQFCSKFGALINNDNGTSTLFQAADSRPHLWKINAPETFHDWGEMLSECLGPERVAHSAGHSIQIFVQGPLASHLTVSTTLNHRLGDACVLIPRHDVIVAIRRIHGIPSLVRLRWVGGVYLARQNNQLRCAVAFDWGDGEDGVGLSVQGNWQTNPPFRLERANVEGELKRLGFGPVLTVFRRV